MAAGCRQREMMGQRPVRGAAGGGGCRRTVFELAEVPGVLVHAQRLGDDAAELRGGKAAWGSAGGQVKGRQPAPERLLARLHLARSCRPAAKMAAGCACATRSDSLALKKRANFKTKDAPLDTPRPYSGRVSRLRRERQAGRRVKRRQRRQQNQVHPPCGARLVLSAAAGTCGGPELTCAPPATPSAGRARPGCLR